MQHTEIEHDRIESSIGQIQRFGIAFHEFETRIAPPCFQDHLGRKIDSHSTRAACRRGRSDIAGTTGNVKDPGSRAGMAGIEDRTNGLCGYGSKGIVVAGCNLLPAFMFELAKGDRIDRIHALVTRWRPRGT